MILVPAIAIAAGLLWYALDARFVKTDNAYVKSDTTLISTDIDGRVLEVHVQDNTFVQKGQLLFTLDSRPYEIQLQQAEASVETVLLEIDAMRAEYKQYLAEISETDNRVEFMAKEKKRQQDLANKGVGTQARLDETIHDWESAQQDLIVAQERSRKALAALGGDVNSDPKQHPKYLSAFARLDEASLNMSYTKIRAPASGVISRMNLEPGEWVEEGRTMFYLIGTQSTWIEANLKETQLTNVKTGQSVKVEIDAFPGQILDATVTRISPATGSEFMVLPPQNATGNWIKVVQRIPVRIELNNPDEAPSLRTGMTVHISIDTVKEDEFLTAVRESAFSLFN